MLLTPRPTFQSEFCTTILPPQRGTDRLQSLSFAIVFGLVLTCLIALKASGDSQYAMHTDRTLHTHHAIHSTTLSPLHDGAVDVSLLDIISPFLVSL